MLLTLRNHHKVLKKNISRVVNVNLKIFKMSRYFTEENDGGMSAEVFTISKDDTNHASKIRSSVMREKGKEFKRSKNELFYAKKKNKAKCSNRLKVLKLRQVVNECGIWRKSLDRNLIVQFFKKLWESSHKAKLYQETPLSSSFLLTWSKYTGPKWPWSTQQASPMS